MLIPLLLYGYFCLSIIRILIRKNIENSLMVKGLNRTSDKNTFTYIARVALRVLKPVQN